jgi:hypothetical protein
MIYWDAVTDEDGGGSWGLGADGTNENRLRSLLCGALRPPLAHVARAMGRIVWRVHLPTRPLKWAATNTCPSDRNAVMPKCVWAGVGVKHLNANEAFRLHIERTGNHDFLCPRPARIRCT